MNKQLITAIEREDVTRIVGLMSHNRRFEEFNRVYMVGQVEPTHAELSHAAFLMLEEVIEVFKELYKSVDIDIDLGLPIEDINLPAAAKEMTDVRYIAGERMTKFGFNVDECDGEVHRSNMSKEVPYHLVDDALSRAKERYPHARAVMNGNGGYVLQCGRTSKVIKPDVLYSPAVITKEMISYVSNESD